LAVPEAGDVVLKRAYATGFQIYACLASGTGYAWVFQAPQADLFRDAELEHHIGTHFKGPTWQIGNDEHSSSVVGKVLAKASIDPTAVPWLLLQAVSSSGDGVLTRVRYIQRVDTVGGIAPTSSCDATNVGASANTPYTATYYFFGLPDGEE